MELISHEQNTHIRYLNYKFPNKILILSAYILFNTSISAYADSIKYENIAIDDYKNTEQIAETVVESDFMEAFYRHTRPYHFDNDLSAKIRNLLSISTGGTNKTKFIGLGFREKSIEWDGLAIETTYKKDFCIVH